MNGKEKCKALKEIRQKIAEENDIKLVIEECTHKGDCKGTCPRCEAEVRYLEKQLALRNNLGKAAVIAGIATSVCGTLTACSPADVVDSITAKFGIGNNQNYQVEGTLPAPTEEVMGDVDISYDPESEDDSSSEADPFSTEEDPSATDTDFSNIDDLLEVESDVLMGEMPVEVYPEPEDTDAESEAE